MTPSSCLKINKKLQKKVAEQEEWILDRASFKKFQCKELLTLSSEISVTKLFFGTIGANGRSRDKPAHSLIYQSSQTSQPTIAVDQYLLFLCISLKQGGKYRNDLPCGHA